jgi:hypothetical protein
LKISRITIVAITLAAAAAVGTGSALAASAATSAATTAKTTEGGITLKGAFYAVENYPNGATGDALATVACFPPGVPQGSPNAEADSQKYVAISGGVEPDPGTNLYSVAGEPAITASFPGRMDWTTNTPKPGRLDGWVVQFKPGDSANDQSLNIWALCVPLTHAGESIPVVTNSAG